MLGMKANTNYFLSLIILNNKFFKGQLDLLIINNGTLKFCGKVSKNREPSEVKEVVSVPDRSIWAQ
jgi:hypothetical protein